MNGALPSDGSIGSAFVHPASAIPAVLCRGTSARPL
jgi:hypothetical protein